MDTDSDGRELLWDLVSTIVLDAESGRIDLATAQLTLEGVVAEWARE